MMPRGVELTNIYSMSTNNSTLNKYFTNTVGELNIRPAEAEEKKSTKNQRNFETFMSKEQRLTYLQIAIYDSPYRSIAFWAK